MITAKPLVEWQEAELGKIATIVMGQSPPGDTYNSTGDGLPFFQGKAEFGEESPTPVKWCSAPTRIAEAGDILLSVRAPVGPTNVASERSAIGRGLAAIRAISNLTITPYLLYFLRYCKPLLAKRSSGSTFASINRDAIASLRVPLPPIPEQYRIATILRLADEVRRLRHVADERLKDLLPAIFNGKFGDPIINPKGWTTKPLVELCDLVRGSSPRPRSDPKYYGGPIPRLMVADLTRDGRHVTPRIDTLTVEGAEKSRWMSAGSVVMVMSGAPGLPAILDVDACIHDGFVGFRNLDDKVHPEYFLGVLLAMRTRNASQAVGGIFENLSTDQVKKWVIPIPPQKLQLEYGQTAQVVEELTNDLVRVHARLGSLDQALPAFAFTGSLTAVWREQHAAELAQSAAEIKGLLEEKHRQRVVDVEEPTPQTSSIRIKIIGAELLQTMPPLANLLADIVPPIAVANLMPALRPFENLAAQLKPFTIQAPDLVGTMLAEQVAQLNAAITPLLADSLAPLTDYWRAFDQPYLADLASKLAHLAQAQLGQSPTRADVQALITKVVDDLPRYWTLNDVAEDWRLNHLPRTTIREAVEMLTVLGQIRSALLQDTAGVIPAYTQVKSPDEVTPDEIRL